jgi:hypothetical protein
MSVVTAVLVEEANIIFSISTILEKAIFSALSSLSMVYMLSTT